MSLRPPTSTRSRLNGRRLLVSLSALTVAAAAAPSALAAGASFALRPVTFDPKVPATSSYFIFGGKRGKTITSEVRVTNAGDQQGVAYLYPVDATTGQTSGTVYLSRKNKRRDVGRWLRLGAQSVTLAPGESRVVSFRFTIPRNVRAGDHVGGIVAENARLKTGAKAQGNKGRGGFRISIRELTIVGVEVQLPGGKPKLSVTGVKAGGQTGNQAVLLGLANTGGVLLKPRGRVSVRDSHGRTVKKRALSLDTLIPATKIDYPVYFPGKPLRPGKYKVRIDLSYLGKQLHVTKTLDISKKNVTRVFGSRSRAIVAGGGGNTMLPWLLMGAALLVATGAVALMLRSRRVAAH
jgi:Bacterial protein of unknown function (DUF916)/Protein of unknown function C-terminal (DUF3324)